MSILRHLAIFFAIALSACASLPDNTNRTQSFAVQPDLAYSQGSQSEFVPLSAGTDAFLARAVLAKRAERTIDAQYYILYEDQTGDAFIGLLLEAADRGVRVRLLVDDFLAKKTDTRLQALTDHPNAEVRLFNPFSRGTPKYLQAVTAMNTITRRMHNKAFIADNAGMVIGGRNIADEYFDADKTIAYNDLDVLTWGPVVADMSTAFDAYWNNELSYPLQTLVPKLAGDPDLAVKRQALLALLNDETSPYAVALSKSDFAKAMQTGSMQVFRGEARIIADDPRKLSASRKATELFLWDKVAEEFAKAESEVMIISPYFVPGKEGSEGLIEMAQSGVRVVVLTNTGATNNHASVHAKYVKYRERLIRGGVELYEFRPDFSRGNTINQVDKIGKDATLHTKAFFIDRERSFVGSLNFDARSFIENTEQGVIFESPDMTRTIMEWMDGNLDRIAFRVGIDPTTERLVWDTVIDGEAMRLNREPDQSTVDSVILGLLKLLPIESKV